MKRNTMTIGALTLSAAVLAAAHWFLPAQAGAQVAVKERDYQAVTAKISTGGDGLYLLDNRTGQVAVFVYDPTLRGVTPMAVRNVADAFTAR